MTARTRLQLSLNRRINKMQLKSNLHLNNSVSFNSKIVLTLIFPNDNWFSSILDKTFIDFHHFKTNKT